MEGTEEESRYPPETYPYPPKHRRPFFKPPPPPPQPDSSDEDINPSSDEHEIESSDSRGKRRRTDQSALRFEFAPRANPAAAAAAAAVASVPPPPAPPPHHSSDWTEDSTFALLDSWGERFLRNGRRSIRSDEWTEVAKIVCKYSPIPRSESQCRNRVDTLKKKYKKEKARVLNQNSSNSNSGKWVYFKKMDSLMSEPLLPQERPQQQMPRLRFGVDSGEYVFGKLDEQMKAGPGDTGSEEDDDRDDRDRDHAHDGFRALADSVQKFGELYEKMESNRKKQMAELERMRKEFQREMEVQKRQILERAQAEIAKIRAEFDDDGDDDGDDGDDYDDEDGEI